MFYVLEGIDGAGCGAQRKNLEKKLREKRIGVETIKYPYYENPIGKMLREFQHGEKTLSVEMQFILYAGQMIAEKEKIANLRKNTILICDRYFLGTLVYQGLRGFSLEDGLDFARMFKLEIPDKIFFLDTPPKVAYERKMNEDGKVKLDINESNYNFIQQVDRKYRELADRQILAHWINIGNTKSIDEVTAKIINWVLKDIK